MCRQNHDINSPINQIITGRDIYYIVGQKVIDGRIYSDQYQNVLPYLPRAQEAFIYEMQEGEKYYNDIGLSTLGMALSYQASYASHFQEITKT